MWFSVCPQLLAVRPASKIQAQSTLQPGTLVAAMC